jgi:hypothetical protein
VKAVLLFVGLVAGLWWALARHEHRLDRIEYWIEVHHPFVELYATPEQVQQRGYWNKGRGA